MGMGVREIPLNNVPPIDTVTRASKAAVEVCRLDGLQVGVGDIHGMLEAQAMASGMGGMRTTRDLVARMQIAKGMRIKEAKEYVAVILKVSVRDLSDPVIMMEVRDDLKLGLIAHIPGRTKGMEAKFQIIELLGIEINSVNEFKQKTGISAP